MPFFCGKALLNADMGLTLSSGISLARLFGQSCHALRTHVCCRWISDTSHHPVYQSDFCLSQWVYIRIDLLGAVDEQLTLFFINLDSFLQSLERKCKTNNHILAMTTRCLHSVRMYFLCLCGFSSSTPASPKSPVTGTFRLIGKSTLHVSVGAVRNKTRPGRAQSSPRDSWDRLQQPTETLSAGISRY